MEKIKVEYMKVDDIIPYVNNPRKNDHVVDKVASSIKNFGFKNPIIIDKGNEIIAGHTRLKAAKKLGLEEVPVIKAEDLNEAQVKAFRIADNKTAELAEWDFDLLSIEFEELADMEIDLELTGFQREELSEILEMRDEDIEVEDDNFIIEEPEEPISREGDIWILGRHKLLCGDSSDKGNVDKLMNGRKVDLILTDPPYNVAYEGAQGMTIQNDDMEDKEFYNLLLEAHKRMYEIAKEGTPIYVFHADTERHNVRSALTESGFKLAQVLVWVKNNFVLGRQDYQWKHESILYGWKEGAAHKWYGGRNKDTVIEDKIDIKNMTKKEMEDLLVELLDDRVHTTVIRENKTLSNELHPTMKPVKLLAYLMKNSSKKKDLVFDPFAGSGSTMIAAEQLGRTCFMIELDERYTDVIVNRYKEFYQSDEGIYLMRNGEKIPYNEVVIM